LESGFKWATLIEVVKTGEGCGFRRTRLRGTRSCVDGRSKGYAEISSPRGGWGGELPCVKAGKQKAGRRVEREKRNARGNRRLTVRIEKLIFVVARKGCKA